jgi:hypothetical protein
MQCRPRQHLVSANERLTIHGEASVLGYAIESAAEGTCTSVSSACSAISVSRVLTRASSLGKLDQAHHGQLKYMGTKTAPRS